MEGAGRSVSTLGHREIFEFNADSATLLRALNEAGPANVLLHYAGRAYHPHGCPLWLPPVLEKWKAKFSSGRLAIIFHEMPGQFPITSRYYWIDLCNRRVIRKLAHLADVLITNTHEHGAKLQVISGRNDVKLIPVSSNIPPPHDLSAERVRHEFVIFGVPFARWQTLHMFDAEIRLWQNNGRLTKLHLVGPPDEKFDARSRKLIGNWPYPGSAIEHGMLSSAEVSKVLARIPFGLSTATVETWSKSSAFMAYASHGCAVVGRMKSEAKPLCFTVLPEEVATITDAALNERTRALKEWYHENADWNVLAREIFDLVSPNMQREAVP
jgi:hypothetical protein